jgi:hypothetical protein
MQIATSSSLRKGKGEEFFLDIRSHRTHRAAEGSRVEHPGGEGELLEEWGEAIHKNLK